MFLEFSQISCESCKISDNTFFTEHLRTTASIVSEKFANVSFALFVKAHNTSPRIQKMLSCKVMEICHALPFTNLPFLKDTLDHYLFFIRLSRRRKINQIVINVFN